MSSPRLCFSCSQALTLAIGAAITTASFAQPLSQRQFVGNDVIGLGADTYLGFLGLEVSPDGRQIYAIPGVENAIVGFSRDANTGNLTVNQVIREDITNRSGIHSGDDVAISGDGRFVFVAGLEPGFGEPYPNGARATTDSAISVFERDATTGNLTSVQVHKMAYGDPFNLSISAGCDMYLTGVNVHTLDVLRCAANGIVGSIQRINNPAPSIPEQHNLDYSEVSAITPNQRHVYVSARDSNPYQGAIYHFDRDATSGQLTYVDQLNYVNPGRPFSIAKALKVSPDGAFLYAASANDNDESDIKTFAIGSNGSLTLVSRFQLDDPQGSPTQLWWPNSIDISTNGRLMYVTDNVANALLVFGRDLITGAIEYYGAEVESKNGVDGRMIGPERVKLSPDNRSAYVSSSYGVAVFDTYAALALSSTPSATSVTPGGEVTYTLRVTNEEGATAHGTTLTFTPPAGVTVRAMKPATPTTSCAQASGVVTCSVDDLAARAAEDVIITAATPTTEGPFAINAQVSAYEVDNDTANNAATSTVTTTTSAQSPAPTPTPTPTPTPEGPSNSGGGNDGGGGGGSFSWLLLGVLSAMNWLRNRSVKQL